MEALSYALKKKFEEKKCIKTMMVSSDESFRWYDIFFDDGTKIQFFYTNENDWAVRTPEWNKEFFGPP